MRQLLMLLICGSAFAQGGPVNFKGTIKNNTRDSIYVESARGNKTGFALDKAGHFAGNYQPGMGIFNLSYGNNDTRVFLSNDVDITITADANDFENSIAFSGKGAAENNFIRKIDKDIDELRAKYSTAGTEEAIKADADAQLNEWKENLYGADYAYYFKTYMGSYIMNRQHSLAEDILGDLKMKEMNGKPSPAFTYENVKGVTTSLADLKGKYVYIDIWATWCAPCRAEIPDLKKLQEKFKGKKIEFVSISIDKQKDIQKWKDLVAKEKLQGVQLIADADWKSDFITAYGINSIPRFILLGPDGNVINADAPRPSEAETEELLLKYLK